MQSNDSKIESFIQELKKKLDIYKDGCYRQLLDYDEGLVKDESEVYMKLTSVKAKIKKIQGELGNYIEVVSDSFEKEVTANKQVDNAAKNDLPSSDSVNIGGSSSSGSYYGGYSSGGSSSNNPSSNSVDIANDKSAEKKKSSNDDKDVNKIDVDALIIDFLVPFGVTKENYGGISKSEKGGYIITMKNINSDGKWNANDIKKYYIENGKIIGILTGDDKYIKVEDGKLVIDETNKNIYTSVMSVGVGAAGSFFATKSNYNTDTNKEIFKKFYPNATDEEFNNFCNNISKSGEEYSAVAEKIIEANKDNISDLAGKTGYNFLTIEDNAIKINYKGMATELYAYESSKTGINFADGIGNEITFNESMVTDIAEYMKSNYSIDIDVNSIFQGVANSNNIASDSTPVE